MNAAAFSEVIRHQERPRTATGDSGQLAEKELDPVPATKKSHLRSGQDHSRKLGHIFNIHGRFRSAVELSREPMEC
jgi:hypothetical protein